MDTKSEMRRYNASIILANVLSRRIQKVLRHTFQYQNWAECYRMKDVLEQMCTTRYSRVDRLPDLKVVGLSDEKLSSRANALSLLDGREGYRGCLALFWSELRLDFDDRVVQPMKEMLEYFVGNH